MVYNIFLSLDEIPVKLGTGSSPFIATPGQRTLSTVERTYHNETPWPIKKVPFASSVLDAAATASTVVPILEAFEGCSIDNNQGEVRSLLVASRGGSIATPSLARGGQRGGIAKSEKESVFQQEAMGIDLDWNGDFNPFTFSPKSEDDERGRITSTGVRKCGDS